MQNNDKIQEISRYYISRRNRICFLVQIFCNLMEFITSKKQVSIDLRFQIQTTMFLLIKFIQASLCRMLKSNQEFNQEDVDLFKITNQRRKIGILLENDEKVVNEFYEFYFKFYEGQMLGLKDGDEKQFQQIVTEIGGLYKGDVSDYKFIKFLKTNAIKKLFNMLKGQLHDEHLANAAHFIYLFEKDKLLFDLSQKDALKNDLYKKYESLKENGVNKQKIKNMVEFQT